MLRLEVPAATESDTFSTSSALDTLKRFDVYNKVGCASLSIWFALFAQQMQSLPGGLERFHYPLFLISLWIYII